jgi:hypothetical protein
MKHCVAEPIRLMLEANLLESLQIRSITSDDADVFRETISSGLSKNQSLKDLGLCWTSLDANMCLQDVLRTKHSLVELHLSLTTNQHWELFRAIERSKTLERLSVMGSRINLSSMEAIMMTCLLTDSLRALSFHHSKCDDDALEFLVRTLSSKKIIDTFQYNQPLELLRINVGTMQVEQLDLGEARFEMSAFSQTMDSIANNPHIKCLNLGQAGHAWGEGSLEKVCETLLWSNHGPTELSIEIDENSDDVDLFIEAMDGNTRLKTLEVNVLDESVLVAFAEGVAYMTCLRKLVFKSVGYSEDFLKALLESMKTNSTLWTLSLGGVDVIETKAKKYLPKIRQYLAINRVGGNRLLAVPIIPAGLWARVMERSSNEPDGIYYLLTERPDIVTPTRKRKNRIES